MKATFNNNGTSGSAAVCMALLGNREGAQFFSFVSMLICTNDGFTGLDTIKLPKKKLTVFFDGI